MKWAGGAFLALYSLEIIAVSCVLAGVAYGLTKWYFNRRKKEKK